MELQHLASSLVASEGLRLGVVVTVFLSGLRHGIDLDHLAAISDITSSQLDRRRSLFLASLYALGHALVLMILGVLAVVAGRRIPAALDSIMGRMIGFTLVVLGLYVIYSLIRYGRDFRLRSRWMLVLSGVRRSLLWLKGRRQPEHVEIVHVHDHAGDGHHPHDPSVGPAGIETGTAAVAVKTVHAHPHKHVAPMPSDPFTEYGVWTSFGIGMIHGVGAETPTQVLLFATAAGVAGGAAGVVLLSVFVLGLFLANTAVAIAASLGFNTGKRLPVVFMALAGLTAVSSLTVGMLYLLGRGDLLPAVLGG